MEKRGMKPWFKNVLMASAVIVFGFILLNLVFLLDVLFQSLLRQVIGLFVELGPETNIFWIPPLMHILFFALILLISFFILRSKLKTIYKAIFLIVPVATVLVTLGIFLYDFPFILYPLAVLLVLATLFVFYKTKQPWIYYFSVILISIALMIFTLAGGEI